MAMETTLLKYNDTCYVVANMLQEGQNFILETVEQTLQNCRSVICTRCDEKKLNKVDKNLIIIINLPCWGTGGVIIIKLCCIKIKRFLYIHHKPQRE